MKDKRASRYFLSELSKYYFGLPVKGSPPNWWASCVLNILSGGPVVKQRKKTRAIRVTNQKKNVRSQRGVPETNYGEIKKIASFSLTPTAVVLLKEISQELDISTSELLERLARLGTRLQEILEQDTEAGQALEKQLEAIYRT